MTRRDFILAGLGVSACAVNASPKRGSIGARDVLLEKRKSLPYDAEVEYLESTGTQYIDTLQTVNTASDVIELKYQLLTSVLYKWVFGEHQNNPRCGIGCGDGTNKRTCAYGNGTSYISDSYYFNRPHEMVIDGNGIALDGEVIRTYQRFSSRLSLLLFAVNIEGGNIQNGSKSRIWSYRHFRDGMAIIDFIPVRFTNELGVMEGGMYDRVSGELFRNIGSGSFIVGPDV